ncbi:uncharacterized protein LOC117177016 [Belonocnema kinseyi]|uniref:uncharacterized protein LOC117177016 n=1 Tax=Belonocnema kinseyi TaxID=2817044 RepID=UPI00143D8C5E|nr:uncharacterized protein LOC117177016 [Belonocnema kinseyi]
MVTGPPHVVFDLYDWHQTQSPPIFSGHVTLGRMTIDQRKLLWVPLNGGSHVLEINPNIHNGVVRFIQLNALKLNACVFGGHFLDILYVSSEPHGFNEARPGLYQGAQIFAVSTLGNGVKGYLPSRFDMPPPPRGTPKPQNRYWW